jgi:uncharacterized protein (TIGR02391 family)
MPSDFGTFEHVVRRAHQISDSTVGDTQSHPFERRNIHELISNLCLQLFDDGHFAQATFEALKLIDKVVQRISGSSESGFKLMMSVFAESSPSIKLNGLISTTEKNEQKGFQFLFAGAVLAIRNPRGHEVAIKDDPDICLDHLSFASLLLRRLEAAGYVVSAIT